jgi:hypothetical protein
MVFFAGFATWYFLKGPEQKEPTSHAPEQKRIEQSDKKQ